jgi:hypothetical protein
METSNLPFGVKGECVGMFGAILINKKVSSYCFTHWFFILSFDSKSHKEKSLQTMKGHLHLYIWTNNCHYQIHNKKIYLKVLK